MKRIKWITIFVLALTVSFVILNGCKPIKNMSGIPAGWSATTSLAGEPFRYDPTKKNVLIIADPKLTELFDMLAPYYLFNTTEKANVYIVAKNETPILVKKDLFVRSQLTFAEVDSMALRADVIIIPALSIRTNQQDSSLIAWIRNHYTPSTRMLAICDGASTAAATGLYDGKPITCHASDFAGIKSQFSRPQWTQNVSVTKSGNLFSTAGVSNAVEGSLAVIDELFGTATMEQVMDNVNYRYSQVRYEHQSVAVNGSAKMTALKKIFFRRNKNLGILMQNGLNEFEFASVLDTYARTFPSSVTTFIRNDSTVKTKFGLSLIFTGKADTKKIDELHVLVPGALTAVEEAGFKGADIVTYGEFASGYPIDVCLKRISSQYGRSFENLVKVSLDYN